MTLIDVWQVPAEKLLDFINSDILRRSLKEFASVAEASCSDSLSSFAILGGDLKLAVEKILSQRCDSPGSKAQQCHIYPHLKKIRHSYEQEVIIAIGGESGNLVLSSMECFTMGFDGWRCSIPKAVALSGIPEPTQVMPTMGLQRSFPAVASYDYGIFVIGGLTQGTNSAACEHYSVPSNEWLPMSALPMAAHGSASAMSNRKLCVSGGRSDGGVERRAWVFEERSNTWEALPPMLNHRAHHGVASFNGLLYAAGGIGGASAECEDYLASVECYDASLQRWIPVAPMQEARAYFGLVSLGPHLYAVGGYNGTSWLRSMERYDSLTKQWTLLTPMSLARSAFGTTVCNGRIYVMGGNDGIHLLNSVEKFNPRTNRWHCAQSMQVRRLGLGAATVKIPLKME